MPAQRPEHRIVRHPSYSPTSTLTSRAESLTFHSDSEKYDEVREIIPVSDKGRSKLARSNTMTGTKKSTSSAKWGYGWGVGKRVRDREDDDDQMDEKHSSHLDMALSHYPVVRRGSKSTQASGRSQDSGRTHDTMRTHDTQRTHTSHQTKSSSQSKESYQTGASRSTAPKPRPPILGNLDHHDSTSTLVGSALERKVNDQDSIRTKADTTERLEEMRRLMTKDNLDY